MPPPLEIFRRKNDKGPPLCFLASKFFEHRTSQMALRLILSGFRERKIPKFFARFARAGNIIRSYPLCPQPVLDQLLSDFKNFWIFGVGANYPSQRT